jgi:hypothetical protein
MRTRYKVLLGIAGAVAALNWVGHATLPSQQLPPAAAVQTAAIGAAQAQVRAMLKDPTSARFFRTWEAKDRVVCGGVLAANSFGAAVKTWFVVAHGSVYLMNSDRDAGASYWLAYCEAGANG